MIGQEISHYKIVSKIGGGGMGVVYKARDTKLDRFVALKFLPRHLGQSEEEKERFIHEAKAASALDHNNIGTIYEIDQIRPAEGSHDPGQMFIAMAFYEGETLESKIKKGPMSLSEAVRLAIQIAQGLSKAHQQKIIHRDIKPANIIITSDQVVKIVDFGLAKLSGVSRLTKAGTTLGTTSYMSPEQARGEETDRRTDIWSLGVVLYEMLTGVLPFKGEYDQSILYAIMNEEPEPLTSRCSEAPAELERIVNMAMAKDPDKRFQHADDMMVDLQKIVGIDSAGTEKRPYAAPARSHKPSLWRIAMVAVPILTAAIVLALFWPQLRPRPADGPRPVIKEAILVLPFSVKGGEEIGYLGEGLVDLLSTKLDGAGELRSIDPNAVLGHLRRMGISEVDPVGAIEIADHFGAGRFILGSVVRAGVNIYLNAALYGRDGRRLTTATSEAGDESQLLKAVDELAQTLIAGELEGMGERLSSMAVLTTNSLSAIKSFLLGEKEMRSVRFDAAVSAYQQATEEDSLFALAWYRLSTAAGWTVQHDLNLSASRRAYELRDRLPERARTLTEAEYAFNSGDFAESERLYRSVLTRYPDDVHTMQQLGDLLFHYNPFFGRSTSEAGPLFRRSLSYDPNNIEVLSHLMEVTGIEGQWGTYDSLLTVYLTNSGDERLEFQQRAIRVLASADSMEREKMTASILEHDFRTVWRTVAGVMTVLYDFDVASELLSDLVDASTPARFRRNTLLWQGVLAVAKGQIQQASMKYDLVAEETAYRSLFLFSIVDRTRPYYPAQPELLRKMDAEIVAWDTLSAPFIFENPLHVGEHADVKAFYRALIAARLQNQSSYRMQLGLLLGRARNKGEHSLSFSLAATLQAYELMQEERFEEALRMLKSIPFRMNWLEASNSPLYSQAMIRFLRAECHYALGNLEDASRWYRSLYDGYYNWGVAYIGPAFLRQAEIYDKMGNIDQAIEYYTRFTKLWKDCDPELRPMLEKGRDRLEALLDQKAKEPAEKSRKLGEGG